MRWKWVLGILAALMLAMIVTIYVILSRYDLNDLKSTIIQTVKEKTGRELTLAGDIKLKMSVKPALIVEGVSFKNASWGSRPELARIKRFEIQVDLLPLISGDAKIKRLILIEPDILIETDQSGKSNLRFTVPKKPKKKPTGTKDLFLLVFRFDEIKILKGRFKYKNGQSGRFYEVNMGGGTLDAFLRLDARKKVPRFQSFLKIEKLNIRRMLKDLKYREMITGNLDLDLRLNGRGTSLARVMGGLSGKILAVVGKGRIANKHIEMLGTDPSSALFKLINPLKAETKYTQVNCLVNRFNIKSGIADATVLVMDTPLMSVVGQGKVYLKTETLDLPLEPSPKKGIAGVSMSFAELAQPFRLKGTLARPYLGIDTAEASLALGKAVGGFILFGPAGILSVLAGRSSSDEDACLEAIKAAELGFKTLVKKKPEKKQTVIDKTTGGIKKTLKKLFD